ncbi:MAG: glycosyltransferase family 4 protein, partial [Chthoniobacterales bacterium]
KVERFHVHFANRAAHTALFVQEVSGIRFGMTAHGQDFMIDLGNEELLREICARADFVAAETDYSRDLLATRCPNSADKMLRVYNGIELEKFAQPSDASRRPGPLRLLSIGRLVEFKGFQILLDACAELRRRGLDFSCEIIGEGDLRVELEARAVSHQLQKNVCFSGERSQDYVLRALADCDLFVLAAVVDSRGASDVFPTVIAEAMTAGKPVISTKVAGIPELIAQGETGLLVPPNEPAALATALEKLMRDESLRDAFGHAGRQRIEQHFTIGRTIEPLLQRFCSRPKTPAASR